MAGLFVIVVAAAVIAGVWITGGPSGLGAEPPAATPTEAAAPEGPRARVALTSNLYAAPSGTAELVAIVPEGRLVRVTGRTDDSTWLRVIYPVASTLEGWVRAANLVEASVPDLAAVPEVATTGGSGGEDGDGGLTDEPALADLTVSSADVSVTGVLTVRMTNVGRAVFSGTVGVRVSSAEGEIVGALDVGPVELDGGRSASVNTGVIVTETGLYLIEIDPANEVEEASEFN
ncbi:MAG: SH3 domain-containing protein, partial [Dehalococcoidia bacterium]